MAMNDQEISYHMEQLTQMAGEFEALYRAGEYGRAHWILIKAEVIANYLRLPARLMSELFGQWADEEDVAEHPDELFNIEKAAKVNWHCCVKAHQTYQDIACRIHGVPVQYYSEPEYCAIKCRHANWNNTRIISEELQ